MNNNPPDTCQDFSKAPLACDQSAISGSTPRKRSRDDWRTIIAEWEATDLSQKHFCEQHGYPLHQFTYYRYLFLQAGRSKKRLVPICLDAAIQKPDSDPPFILHLPTGATLPIPQAYDTAALKKLLSALGVGGC